MRKKIRVQRAYRVAVLVGGAVGLLAACTPNPSNPTVQSDSGHGYVNNPQVPTDTAVYSITGVVDATTNSVTRQTSPGGGSITSYNGYTSGTYFGPVTEGKGYVRLRVQFTTPNTDSASVGTVVILKVTDTKATALLPGDRVRFKCRRQYEAVAAMQNNERFDQDKDGTWELDYCRMDTPEAEHPAA